MDSMPRCVRSMYGEENEGAGGGVGEGGTNRLLTQYIVKFIQTIDNFEELKLFVLKNVINVITNYNSGYICMYVLMYERMYV